MHRVSKNTVLLAQKHALETLINSKSMEGVVSACQTTTFVGGGETDKSLEESRKNTQDKVNIFLEKTQKLAEDNSIKAFLECVSAHVDMTNSHIEAVNKFLRRKRHATTKETTNDHN